jgi:hypothetical protein
MKLKLQVETPEGRPLPWAAQRSALVEMGFTESRDDLVPGPFPTFHRGASGWPLICVRPKFVYWGVLEDLLLLECQ